MATAGDSFIGLRHVRSIRTVRKGKVFVGSKVIDDFWKNVFSARFGTTRRNCRNVCRGSVGDLYAPVRYNLIGRFVLFFSLSWCDFFSSRVLSVLFIRGYVSLARYVFGCYEVMELVGSMWWWLFQFWGLCTLKGRLVRDFRISFGLNCNLTTSLAYRVYRRMVSSMKKSSSEASFNGDLPSSHRRRRSRIFSFVEHAFFLI